MNCELLTELNVVFWSNLVKIGQNLTFDPKAAILKLGKNQKFVIGLLVESNNISMPNFVQIR